MDKRFSIEEARRIFALAAEREQSAQADPQDMLTLADLEEAGLTAGIDPAFIRAAAVDVLRPDHLPVQRTLMGMPVEFRRTRVYTRKVSEEEWRRLVKRCQQVFDTEGVVTDLGVSREWASEADDRGMPVRVVLEDEGDESRLTIERKTWRRAIGYSIGSVINLSMGLVLLVTWLASGAGGSILLPAMALTMFGILFGAGAILGLRSQGRREAAKFEEIASHLDGIVVPGEAVASTATATATATATTATAGQASEPLLSLDQDEGESARDSPATEARPLRE